MPPANWATRGRKTLVGDVGIEPTRCPVPETGGLPLAQSPEISNGRGERIRTSTVFVLSEASPAELDYAPVNVWCGWRDLNSHARVGHRNLSPARMPFRHSRKNLGGSGWNRTIVDCLKDSYSAIELQTRIVRAGELQHQRFVSLTPLPRQPLTRPVTQ